MRNRPLFSPPLQLFKVCWKNRQLVRRLVAREIQGRYKSSILGLLWSVLVPLMMLLVYTLVFSVIFESRWGNRLASRYEFAVVLFAGMVCFTFLSDCLARAPSLMYENLNYIKKVVFPLEILAWVQVLVALFTAVVSFGVLALAYGFVLGTPPLAVLALPLLALPLFLLALGCVWLFSSLGVYIPDIRQAIGIIITLLMFLSPIFYPIEVVPEKLRWYMSLNPLVVNIESIRSALFWGHLPKLQTFAVSLTASYLFAWISFSWFQVTKRGFADVI